MYDDEVQNIVQGLSQEWDIPDGFFYNSRSRKLDPEGYERVISLLKRAKDYMSSSNDTVLDREFVKNIWFIPIFLEWQSERVLKKNDDTGKIYLNWVAAIEKLIEEILGTP